jgi:hypothetical protein
MSKTPKVSKATQVVLTARAKYPEILQGAIAYLGGSELPYMQERLDPRTADKRLMQMTTDQMAELARTDPAAAEQAAQRIATLEARQAAIPPAPLQDTWEPE